MEAWFLSQATPDGSANELLYYGCDLQMFVVTVASEATVDSSDILCLQKSQQSEVSFWLLFLLFVLYFCSIMLTLCLTSFFTMEPLLSMHGVI